MEAKIPFYKKSHVSIFNFQLQKRLFNVGKLENGQQRLMSPNVPIPVM